MRKIKENNIKTLYVTDLDGTLLDSNACLTENSYKILQSLIDNGQNIMIATGRTRDNALDAIKPLKINLPIICDNGTFIYDIINKKFLKKDFIDNDIVNIIIKLAQKADVMPFVNSLKENDIYVFHSHINNSALKMYYKERTALSNSKYIKDVSYEKHKKEKVFNISMLSTYEKLSIIFKQVKIMSEIEIELFPSHYYEGYWWLEILPHDSGKGNALDIIKKLLKPEKIVCFGDNLNDLSMFNRADYSIAPSNALSEVKEVADEIIGHCDDDSVALYIKNQLT